MDAKLEHSDWKFPFCLSIPQQVRTGQDAVHIMFKFEHASWTLL